MSTETINGRTQAQIVLCFFMFMWNRWNEEECKRMFGWNYLHFWNKWCACCVPKGGGAAERFFAELDLGNQQLLVDRACEYYDENLRTIKHYEKR